MKQVGVIARGRFFVLIAALLFGLSLALMQTSQVGAAPATHDCAAQVALPAEAGGTTAGQPQQPEQPVKPEIVVGGCATFVEIAPPAMGGTTCAFTLPEGVAPGSTIIVSQPGGSAGCAMEIVEPDVTTFEIVPADSLGQAEFCSASMPGELTVTSDPQPGDGGTVKGEEGSFTVVTEPGVPADAIDIAPTDEAVFGMITCGTGILPANQVGGEGTISVVQGSANGGCSEIVVSGAGGTSTEATATAGEQTPPAVEDGVVGVCSADASGGQTPPGSGTSSSNNTTWTCTMGSDPNVAPVCTRTP